MKRSQSSSKRLSRQAAIRSTHRSLSKKKTSTSSLIYSKKSINASLLLAKTELAEIVSKCIQHNSVVYYDDKAVTCTKIEFCRMLSEWSRKSSLDKAIRNIILSAFFSSEQLLGSSGIISCMMFVDDVLEVSKKRKVKEKDVRRVIDSWISSGMSKKIANEIFSMGACGVEVLLEESETLGTKVECITGVSQDGFIDNLFSSKLPEDFSVQEDFYVVAIDGIVEKISQIHSLLDKTSGQNLLILARGFLPDVSNTLSANYQKSLKCIPFVVDKDWCCKNFLDLEKAGVSCASSVIGSEISKIDKKDKVKISLSKTKVQFSEFLLSSAERKICVYFGNDLQKLKGVSIDRVKFLLGVMRFTSRSGISTLKYGDYEFYAPSSAYSVAKRTSDSLEKILQNLGKVITYS